MNPEKLKEALKGKKTYLAVLIGLAYLAGVWAGCWDFDEKVLGAVGLGGLAFLRAGLGTKVGDKVGDKVADKVAILGLIGLMGLMTGCTTALQSDKIVAVKQRCFGLVVETTSPTANMPNVKLGFASTVWQMIPTSTNGAVNAPRYMDTFGIDQGLNPFKGEIHETTGTGEVYVGGTNDVSKAIVPSAYVPK